MMLIGGETNRHFLPCFPLFHTFLPLCVICDAPAVCLSKLTNCLSTNPSIQLSINRQSTVALHPSCAAQAALRVFVPSSMPVGTLPAVAFQAFRALPDGLAKVRWEQEMHAWCGPYIRTFQRAGFRLISDMLPLGKFVAQLQSNRKLECSSCRCWW